MLRKKVPTLGHEGSKIHCSRAFIAFAVLTILALLAVGSTLAANAAAEPSYGVIGSIFNYFAQNPFAYLFLALALGYPLGRITVGGINLGTTAGTLVVGIAIALVSSAGFGITYEIPGLVQDIFLMMFMYALGMRVGPQFFSGLKSGGLAFVVIGLTVWALNWVICFFGAKAAGLDAGYIPGLIAGSYTITAVMGVAQGALQSGAFTPPDGITVEQVGANIAAGYAISYILSSIGIILLIRYLPQMFGRDPVADAKVAEEAQGEEPRFVYECLKAGREIKVFHLHPVLLDGVNELLCNEFWEGID